MPITGGMSTGAGRRTERERDLTLASRRRMIVEAASTDEAAEKLGAQPLVREGYLQPPTIVPLKPYSGFAPCS
jgi:hypothetical protein